MVAVRGSELSSPTLPLRSCYLKEGVGRSNGWTGEEKREGHALPQSSKKGRLGVTK